MTVLYASSLTDPLHQRLHEIGVAERAPRVERLGGDNRYETAAMLSRGTAVGGQVWVASGQDYPDALAAAARAGQDSAAVLLVRPDTIPSATRLALARLAPSQIIVTGGETAIGATVLARLRDYSPSVVRISGANRYGTAAEVATFGNVTTGGRVYLVSGVGYADALAAAAQAGADGSAVLLTRPDRVPRDTLEALGRLRPSEVVVVGGELAIHPRLADEVAELTGASVTRVAGPDRYATAAALAESTSAGTVLHVSQGNSYPDALAAAPAAAAAGGAVLLVGSKHVPAVTAQTIRQVRPGRVILTGGPLTVSKAVEHDLHGLIP